MIIKQTCLISTVHWSRQETPAVPIVRWRSLSLDTDRMQTATLSNRHHQWHCNMSPLSYWRRYCWNHRNIKNNASEIYSSSNWIFLSDMRLIRYHHVAYSVTNDSFAHFAQNSNRHTLFYCKYKFKGVYLKSCPVCLPHALGLHNYTAFPNHPLLWACRTWVSASTLSVSIKVNTDIDVVIGLVPSQFGRYRSCTESVQVCEPRHKYAGCVIS